MSVSILSNFNYKGKLPDFTRAQFETLSDMKSFSENYLPEIYEAFCIETRKKYRYDVNNDTEETTGKWREVVSGGSVDIPTASTTVKGAVKVGDGLKMTGETLSAESQTDENFTSELKEKLDNIDMSTKVDVEEGKTLTSNDFTDDLKKKLDDIEEGANKIVVDTELSDTSINPVQNKVIKVLLGASNGIATLDGNGKLPASQLPTTARQIVGYIDNEEVHTLPDVSGYNPGDELVVTASGYYIQSTTFTLKAGKVLTEMEVAQANLLIKNSYVFTLADSTGELGTVKTFDTDKVTFSDDSVINLPYVNDLTATSNPSVVQITTSIGDEIMNIDSHWVHLSNTSNVSSVNGKTGAVVLSASDVGAVDTDSVVTEFSETTSDTNIPSEKLVKDSLDSKVDSSVIDGYAGEEWTFTLSDGSTVTKTVFCK